jgi:hypothetical protein
VRSKAAVAPSAGKNLDDKSTLVRYAFLTCKKARKLVEYRGETSSQRIPASCLGFTHTFTAADSGKTFPYFCQVHGGPGGVSIMVM